jgi:hypothetical protein
MECFHKNTNNKQPNSLQLQEKYPELVKYLAELTAPLSTEENKEPAINVLKIYFDSLTAGTTQKSV